MSAIEQIGAAVKGVIPGMFLQRGKEPVEGGAQAQPGTYNDEDLLKLFKKCKKESFESRWIWERGWMRNIHYVNNRHWIEYVRKTNEWRDVRLAKWFPKPVTNKIGEGVQALRAMFASVNIGANVRPVGADPKNVAVAAVADEMLPLLHEEHDMDHVLNEADFWFIVCGNVFLHTYLERDLKHGFTTLKYSQCMECQEIFSDTDLQESQGACPSCQSTDFMPAMNPEMPGAPLVRDIANGKGVTAALSPFELVFSNDYARFEDVPYVIRLRWRTKTYYQNHPTLKDQVANIKWSKAPSETALQLFRSLPYHNDMGVAPFLSSSGGTGENTEEGAAEYEMWVRPCNEYPDGLVMRVLGDGDPILLHLEDDEAIPGPLPYTDHEGKAVFTFSHAAFEQRGGRVYGTSPLDSVIQKQNMLNQLDAFILMIVNRMGNPVWLKPKGAEIQKFTGEPGLVVEWNPLTVQGNAKPERIDGVPVNAGLFQIRDMYLKDIEEGLGTYDIVKGSKPAGVEAFSAMQLLVERSQSRFASAFKARGGMYKDWAKFALELERDFGNSEKIAAVKSPAGAWTMKTFETADLQGSFMCVVEDGSNTPKTTLGIRAAIEHLNSMGLIDVTDPDQKYKIYQLFGQSELSPSLSIHTQAALRKQELFEQWATDPAAQEQSLMKGQEAMAAYQQSLATVQEPPPPMSGADPNTGETVVDPQAEHANMQAAIPPPPPINQFTPLAWKPWYNAPIHRQEFMKWANSDRIMQLLGENPALEPLLIAHQQDIEMAMMQEMALMAPPPKPGGGGIGAGEAMANSNGESGGAQNSGGGSGGKRQGVSRAA